MIAFPVSAVVAEEVAETFDPGPVKRVADTAGQNAVLTRAGVDPQQGSIALVAFITHVARGTRVPDKGPVWKDVDGVGLMVPGGDAVHEHRPVTRRCTVAEEKAPQAACLRHDQCVIEQGHIVREVKTIKPGLGFTGPPITVVGERKEDDAPPVAVTHEHGLVVQPLHAGGTTEVADQQVHLHALFHHGIVHVGVGPNLPGDDQQKQRGH